MVDVRSEKKEIKEERRVHPRLELHCDTIIPGLKGIQKLTDISFGGCFIEAKIPGKVKIGQIITVNTKLPTEKHNIKVKAKIVNQRERGIGCQFISLQDDARDAICTCFEMYKDTLPAGEQEAQWENECLETVPEAPPPESKKETKKEIKPPPLSEIPETSQIESTKTQGRHNMLLKAGLGLAIVLLAGYFMVNTILRPSPNPDPEPVTRHTVAATPQSHTIKAQAQSGNPIDNRTEQASQNNQGPTIEDEKIQSENAASIQEQNVPQAGAEPIEIAATPPVSKEKGSSVVSPKMPDQKSSGINDENIVNLKTETTTDIPIPELYSMEIGPIFRKHELQEATDILHDNGLDPEEIVEMGKVEAFRLFEGAYTRELAKKRLQEIRKVVDSAFVIPEKGKLSIYVATYYDIDKAIQKSKQLAKNNIKVIAVPTELKMEGTKLVVKRVRQPNISTVQDQVSKIGLPVKILKSD